MQNQITPTLLQRSQRLHKLIILRLKGVIKGENLNKLLKKIVSFIVCGFYGNLFNTHKKSRLITKDFTKLKFQLLQTILS